MPDFPLARPPSWTERAECRTTDDPDQFTPKTEPPPRRLHRLQQKYCNPCPVSAQCLALRNEWGLEGIWAGQWHKNDSSVRERALKREIVDRVKAGETDASIARMTLTTTQFVAETRTAEGLPKNPEYGSGLTTPRKKVLTA